MVPRVEVPRHLLSEGLFVEGFLAEGNGKGLDGAGRELAHQRGER